MQELVKPLELSRVVAENERGRPAGQQRPEPAASSFLDWLEGELREWAAEPGGSHLGILPGVYLVWIRDWLKNIPASDHELVRQALRTTETLDAAFELVRQPIVELASGEVSHHELLLRMRDDRGQLIKPGDFASSIHFVEIS